MTDNGHHHRKAVTPNVPEDSLHQRIWTGDPELALLKTLAHTQPRHHSHLKIIKILLHWFHLSLLSIAHIPCLEGSQWNHPFTTSCVFLTHTIPLSHLTKQQFLGISCRVRGLISSAGILYIYVYPPIPGWSF